MLVYKSMIARAAILAASILPVLGCSSSEQVQIKQAEIQKNGDTFKALIEQDEANVKNKVANVFAGLIRKSVGFNNFFFSYSDMKYTDAKIGSLSIMPFTNLGGSGQIASYCVHVKRSYKLKGPTDAEAKNIEDYIVGAVYTHSTGSQSGKYTAASNARSVGSKTGCSNSVLKPFPELEKLLPSIYRP